MRGTKLIWLVIAWLLVSSTMGLATSPQNYTISYTFRNPDQTIFRVMNYYLLDGLKFRIEYITPVQYHMNNAAPLQVEILPPDTEPHTIAIFRNDQGMGWELDTYSRTYIEFALRPHDRERSNEIFFPFNNGLEKSGATTVLGYSCYVFESSYQVQEDVWTQITFATQDLGIVLKSELLVNGNSVQVMEATELSLEKPEESLFELPSGYGKRQVSQ